MSDIAPPVSMSRNGDEVPKAKREYLAMAMLAVLRDQHSLGYYRHVADTVNPHRIYEALSIVQQMAREGRVRKNRGALFVSLIKAQSVPRVAAGRRVN